MSAVIDFPSVTRAPLTVIGADVPVPAAGGRTLPYANLDYAASTPCLGAVRDALDAALPYYSSVHRGAGYASQVTTDRYEQARETVRAFVGAWRKDAVVFTRNTTDAMNLLAHALPRDTTVVVFESEHHASLLPWQRGHRVVRLPVPSSPAAAVEQAAAALAAAPPGPRLLVVTAASNVTGEVWPVAKLAAVAREHGARIAVDAAQFVPHRPFDMAALDVDYVAFSGHKLYAPFGAGCLVGRADWLRAAEPYLLGGGATATVDEHTTWSADPQQRHEAGTPNVLGVVALAAACEALDRWDTLVAEEERLLRRLRAGLAEIPDVRELCLWDGSGPRVGIVSFVVAGHDSHEVATRLSEEYGIGVRDGRFCAHPFVRRLLGDGSGGCGSTGDGTALRASFGIGTTEAHVDRLVAALRRIAG